MAERGNGKKSTSGTTLDLMDDEEPAQPRAARRPAAPAPAAQAAPAEMGGALFGGDEVDLDARHPADVPVGNFPAPSQIAQLDGDVGDPFGEDDPFEDTVMARMLADEPAPLASPLRAAREDFNLRTDDEAPADYLNENEAPVMMAAPVMEEPPIMEAIAEPTIAEAVPEPVAMEAMEVVAEPIAEPLVMEAAAEPLMEATAGPDLEAFADPVAVPEVEQKIEAEQELVPAPVAVKTAAPKAPASPKNGGTKTVKTNSPGLSIPRRYTQAGRDVWDSVEWELRNASIVGSDGTVVFEQNGVEIPKDWSQLATNVVVSKYFRGQIGTLEREYSVKQLIGRVSDRILEWAKQGSYFAAEADAEAFHDELRFILLHQYAAFNSPVWFNLGWAGRRQAVSACLPYDVRVNTDRGLLPIGEIVRLFQSTPDPQIFTYAPDGAPSRIVKGICNGRKRVVNFHLADGSTLRCTSNHRVFVRVGKGEIAEKKAGDLVIGVDRLVLSRHVLLPETADLSLNSITPDADVAWLTGLMVGDGYCGRSETLTSDTWDLKLNTLPEKERAEGILTRYGVPFHTHVKSWGFCLRGHGAVSRAFWSALGLWGRVGDKQVPEWVYRTGRENVAAFLGGLFDADGHVTENGNRRLPVFSNTSLPLMQATQTLLRSLGIYASLTAYTDSRDDFSRKTSYSLGIHDNVSVEQFEDLIGFTHAHKQARMTQRQVESASSWRSSDVLVVSKTLGGPEYVYDIQTESETFWAEGVLLHNCYINEVDDTMESILDLYKTEGMLFKDGSGSGLNLSPLRSSKEPLEAGGRSSGPISFMKGLDASAGSIKSGGSTRRAACMRVLNIDHPDIKEFIDCKKDAELKAHALIDAGYSGAFNVAGGAYDTVPFQNANHSVRVTDEFMQAVEADAPWDTKFRMSGKTAETFRAKDLLHSIAEGTWVCGDPGMQYDTTANDWHTCANTDRIHASNPCCFVGETLVETAEGQIPFVSLYGRHEAQEALPSVFSYDRHSRRPVLRPIRKVWVAGHTRRLVEVKTERGLTFRCTPEHRFLTQEGVYVEAQHLAAGTALCSLRCASKDLPENEKALQSLLAEATDVLLSMTPLTLDADVPVYDMEVEDTHNFAITDAHSAAQTSIVVSNSEFFFLNSTACNLSSLNLMKFRQEGTGAFDTASFEHAVRIMITAQEIVVGFASYPTAKIEQRSHEFRPLGLGYANLGALLMAAGLPYDSDAGRAYAGAVTALMTGRAYHQSALVARDCGGPFAGFAENRDPMLRVMHKHRDHVDLINETLIPDTLLAAARTAWDEAVGEGEVSGYRNAQSTVLAPTGTIGFLMDCDTTGIEPDIAIVKYKSLVGGGMMKIVNQTVPEALQRLGYDEAQVEGIIKFIDEHDTIEGAPDLSPEHLPIFDCAFRPMNGTRSIHYRGHIKMMAAAQPFISGAISKTVNVPNDATPDDIAETYMEAWKLGIKAVAIYRDGSKRTQPLNTSKEKPAEKAGMKAVQAEDAAAPVTLAPPKAVRRRLPDERSGVTHKFSIGGHEGYLTVGLYPDTHQPGEIFIRMSKEGSSISGLMDSFATAISLALQYGVPLSTLVDKFIHSRFEPSGFTGNKEIPMAKSVMDYIFRYLALRFLQKEDRHNVGLIADQDDSAYAAPAKLAAPPPTPAHDSNSGSLSNGKNGNGAPSKASDLTHLADTNTATIADHEREIYRMQSDAPPCPECGAITIRSGACYKCLSCGTSLGCS